MAAVNGIVNGIDNETTINENTTERTDMTAIVEENNANDSMVFQRPPLKSSINFRQRRSGSRWITPHGRVQTPRSKRARTYTDSLSSVDESLPLNSEVENTEDIAHPHIIKVILAELDEMRTQMLELAEENKRLDAKCTKLDCLSRRNNLKIWGIIEEDKESKYDLKRTVMKLLTEYGVNINARDIGEVHRLGAKKARTTRGTLVNFLHAEDRELTLSRGKQMYLDYGVRLEMDFPLEIDDNRKELKPVLQAALRSRNDTGGKKYNAYLSTDKLNINGRQYTVDNMDTLPEELN